MPHARRFVVAALTSVSMAIPLVGCAAQDTDDVADVTDEVETLSEQSEVSSCPANPPVTQKKVHTALMYTLGGGHVRVLQNMACDGKNAGTLSGEAISNIHILKGMLEDGSAILGGASKTSVCGVSVAERHLNPGSEPVYGTARNAARLWMAVQNIARELDACWPGAKNFVYLGTDGKTIKIDPEPVKLTQSLSSSNGATAAGVFVNNNDSTDVLKWLTTAAPGTAAGGTPCSTSSLSANTETLKLIQVLPNGYRRCL